MRYFKNKKEAKDLWYILSDKQKNNFKRIRLVVKSDLEAKNLLWDLSVLLQLVRPKVDASTCRLFVYNDEKIELELIIISKTRSDYNKIMLGLSKEIVIYLGKC